MYGEVITVGILVSLLYSQLTGLSPAGLIVSGYLALSLGSPYKLLWTAVVVLLTLGVYELISRYTILYGQRRFALMVVISLAIGGAISALPLPFSGIGVIGYLIPGILAKECSRQGILKTLLSVSVVTAVTAILCLLLGAELF